MRHLILALAVLGTIGVAMAVPPVPQPLAYHEMADRRTIAGIPNAFNVLSNLPFAIVGVLGLIAVGGGRGRVPFVDPWQRRPYAALFAGVALTAVGSSYYHLAPDNARLVWDRLPMTIGFMGLLTAVIGERIGVRPARRLFVPLLLTGAGSVGYWWWTETSGAGDLRPYAVVQFGSLLAVLLLLALYRSLQADGRYIVVGLAAYAASKGFEAADAWFLQRGQIVSGHSLKHLAAAGGVWCVVAMLRARVGERQQSKAAQPWTKRTHRRR
jgi:hypothetical protein